MGVADEGKRDGRCEGMGDVRDGKVLRDTDSWGKKKSNKCEGTCQTTSPLPVKKDVIRNHICNSHASRKP